MHAAPQLVSTVERSGKNIIATIALPVEAASADSAPQLQWCAAVALLWSQPCAKRRLWDSKLTPRSSGSCRGVYRTSPAKWFHPKSVVPLGSEPTSSAGMRSPFTAAPGGGHQIQLTFSADLAPLTLAFSVAVPGALCVVQCQLRLMPAAKNASCMRNLLHRPRR